MVAYAILSRGRSAESCRNMAKEDHAKMRETGASGSLVYYDDYKSAEDANASRRRHAAGEREAAHPTQRCSCSRH
jgi:hypothetical protein